jgi:tetratricopeptide (TPR) repeat protein
VITFSPKRLLEEGDDVANLLERALDDYGQGLDANQALLRLRAPKKSRLQLGSWLVAGAVATAGVALLVGRQARTPNDALLVTAEAPAHARPSAPAPADRGLEAKPSLAKPQERPAHALLSLPPAHEVQEQHRPPPSVSSAPIANPGQPPAGSAEEECLAHARAGEPRLAAACFAARANGSGLSAQVALYELSRLQRDALGEPNAALASLTQYLERFPSGSLNSEARFSRLELLARLGRTQEALSASSEFLGSRFGAERAAEVHLLRGNLLLRGAGSAAQAVSEYRAAFGAPGRVGDDAAYQLAAALEATGAKAEAQSAYQRYLAKSGGRHRSQASARLAELSK